MNEFDFLKQQHVAGRISRRELLGRAAALGAGAAMLANLAAGVDAHAAETPRKGGHLRLGLAGGSTTDSLDPTTWNDSVNIDIGGGVYNALVEVDPHNKPVPELAESWEAKPGATVWIFNLRKGVTFHNGKTFDADDAVFSLNLHRGNSKSGAAGSFKEVADVKKLSPGQIQVTLSAGDADFPTVLTDYHVKMVPADTKDLGKGVGTGGYAIEHYDPGVRATGQRYPNYWKQGHAHPDSFEVTVINDVAARMAAMSSGQVDAVNRVDPKQAKLLKRNPRLGLVVADGGWHCLVSMLRTKPPFDNADMRKAMQYAFDRPQIVKTLFAGYGDAGNDHPISKSDAFYNAHIPQMAYDPDKAKFHAKQAGFDGTVLIQASDAAFAGAVDMATLMQASAKKAGIKIDVKREPADGFWDNVWLKGDCVTSYWGGRAAATQMLAVAYQSGAPWNESQYNNPKFDALLAQARAEVDYAKRKQLVGDLQSMLNGDPATIVLAFKNWIDAHNTKVGGHIPFALFDMNGGYILDDAWLKA